MFDKLFKPKSVAVIGASQKALSIGNVITKNLLKYEYKGPIYPINPKADEILGVKAYPSILDVPGEIDLAHISIPAKFSPQAIDECGKKGVKFVIINSAGFREIGEALDSPQTGVSSNLYTTILPRLRSALGLGKDALGPRDIQITTPANGDNILSIFAYPNGRTHDPIRVDAKITASRSNNRTTASSSLELQPSP